MRKLSDGYLFMWSVAFGTLLYDVLFGNDIMMEMFLDPNRPLYTCKADGCEGCAVSHKLVCHFKAKQLILFLALALPLFICAGYFVL